MRHDSVDEVPSHVRDAFGVVVEGRHDGVDGRAGLRCLRHVAEMDQVERGLANAQNERAPLLEADVGGTLDEGTGEAVGNARKRAHRAGQDDHGRGGVGAAGNVCTYVRIGQVLGFRRDTAKKALWQVDSAGNFKLFRQNAQGTVAGYEVNVGDAGVRLKLAKGFRSKETSGSAGNGESYVHLLIISPALCRCCRTVSGAA
jgi:hypothetical protein